ncbi:mechanosensitive ion channel family protein [Paenibacillus sp. D51F]
MNPYLTNAAVENAASSDNEGTLASAADQAAEKTNEFLSAMKEQFSSTFWVDSGIILIKIALILLIGRLIILIVNKSIDRILERESKVPLQTRRVVTVGRLMKNVASYVVYFITAMLVLPLVGIQIGPLLAGAGVLGLAIGFGAQSLVKDVITGFFIILEDQFAVGDIIQTGTYKGTVELIGLRTTRLKSWTGEVHIIPNGTIAQVTNYSRNNSLAVIDVDMPNADRLDETVALVKDMLAGMENANLVKPPELLGISSMTTAEYKLRIVAECMPNTEASVTRQINMDLQRLLREREDEQQDALA